ncbi:hypothetical protein HY990_04755 [Candidatus Micrarchaeota archaeon]|nr:hypothetical protein [Candidatus Micrarchaeota archaeon]
MKSKIIELIDLSRKNTEICEWCKDQSSRDYLARLKDEVAELELAFKNNDLKNIEEELGDVLWDTITLAYICEREGKLKSDAVISGVLAKFARRKPWLIRGEKVSKEEAGRIWVEAKRKEKEQK